MATTHHQPLLDSPKRKLCPCEALSLVLSLVAIITPITILTTKLFNQTSSSSSNPFSLSATLCHRALDQSSCSAMVSELAPPEILMQMNGVDLLQAFLKKSESGIRKTMKTVSNINRQINDKREQAAIVDCMELMEVSLGRVMDSVVAIGKRTAGSHSDAHSWLSGVLTNHVTCLDGLTGSTRSMMETELNDMVARARASLAMVVAVSPLEHDEVSNSNQLELSLAIPRLNGEFPRWVTTRDRKLLKTSPKDINADVVVAQDGSGNYGTVNEAVSSVPDNGNTRYVIYVKQGTYNENVVIGSNKKNVMLVGDGMDLTIITGNLNVIDGSTTFDSATVAAVGDGFIAQDICIQNTAGAVKEQAVALRVGADQSVINRCRIDAYQDTLYAHSNRQFYRDSYITGTIDFIFGNAAVVLQNCNIVARLPMSGQFNAVTAQGKNDPNQNTGTSIQTCNVTASLDLEPVKGTVKSYLGRPWKAYSTTIFMQSYIEDHIDPAGWAEWDGDLNLNTLYYGEYMNYGSGAGITMRVAWLGYHVITDPAEASKFTVAQLIQGGEWLDSTGVTYTEGL
ncbi:pectinesterase-like [Camellia sinensis]|uniref:pectinesterase-like n=1 Tax=Camellia sinensis TaxID=4442 RepID=UPI001035F33A|nr:pectinesterase-like [Camellia sinensis]